MPVGYFRRDPNEDVFPNQGIYIAIPAQTWGNYWRNVNETMAVPEATKDLDLLLLFAAGNGVHFSHGAFGLPADIDMSKTIKTVYIQFHHNGLVVTHEPIGRFKLYEDGVEIGSKDVNLNTNNLHMDHQVAFTGLNIDPQNVADGKIQWKLTLLAPGASGPPPDNFEELV